MQTVLQINCIIHATIIDCEDIQMDKKFKIPNVPPTTNKTIRFPNDVIVSVEKAITGKNCSFSTFVIEAVRVALANLDEPEQEQ